MHCCVGVLLRDQGSGGVVYRSAWQGLSSIVRHEGVRALYAGVLPSLVKDCPYAAVYLLLYTRLKERLTKLSTAWHSHSAAASLSAAVPSRSSLPRQSEWHVAGQTPIVQFVSAFGAATVATVAFQPLEVLKTRLQLPSSDAAAPASSFSRFHRLTVSPVPLRRPVRLLRWSRPARHAPLTQQRHRMEPLRANIHILERHRSHLSNSAQGKGRETAMQASRRQQRQTDRPTDRSSHPRLCSSQCSSPRPSHTQRALLRCTSFPLPSLFPSRGSP